MHGSKVTPPGNYDSPTEKSADNAYLRHFNATFLCKSTWVLMRIKILVKVQRFECTIFQYFGSTNFCEHRKFSIFLRIFRFLLFFMFHVY